jgi:hypothetical protein
MNDVISSHTKLLAKLQLFLDVKTVHEYKSKRLYSRVTITNFMEKDYYRMRLFDILKPMYSHIRILKIKNCDFYMDLDARKFLGSINNLESLTIHKCKFYNEIEKTYNFKNLKYLRVKNLINSDVNIYPTNNSKPYLM